MGAERIEVEPGSVDAVGQRLRTAAEVLSSAVGSAEHPVAGGIGAAGDLGAGDGISCGAALHSAWQTVATAIDLDAVALSVIAERMRAAASGYCTVDELAIGGQP